MPTEFLRTNYFLILVFWQLINSMKLLMLSCNTKIYFNACKWYKAIVSFKQQLIKEIAWKAAFQKIYKINEIDNFQYRIFLVMPTHNYPIMSAQIISELRRGITISGMCIFMNLNHLRIPLRYQLLFNYSKCYIITSLERSVIIN
jgi:hypothetical protein